ncbi:MAG: Iron-sulfur cluster assembly scaffold protein IscU/NifU-like [Candidatus Ozemobacter sibiricus]|jgi:nitrogen fixation NifU-like protein|uniref:Iron-sulfur cluster assembly scaffold protein IscU/NifU-like n=1 Tax=Candidatus Ozemobacter sibiricus TaxID=2268124 RepID=A0A367ZUP6_9BACT|nr:MAG: Iron-sulfur cluster assembly scaffold protein IscU/NifU-like [Candidatus Ozemobacter sibiricus]
MSRYSARVLDHFQNPRHVGHVTPRDGLGRLGDPDCGDFLEVSVRLSEDHQRLAAVGYLIKGCPAAIATASMMAELVDQRTVEEALQLTDQQVIDALDGLPPGKEHCSVLAVKGLHLALQDALIRRLFKKAGLARDDEEFDRLVASGQIAEILRIHTCDGSCEQDGHEGCSSDSPPASATAAPDPIGNRPGRNDSPAAASEQIASVDSALNPPLPGRPAPE